MSGITSLRRGAFVWWRGGGLGAVSELKQGIPLNRQRATATGFSTGRLKYQGREEGEREKQEEQKSKPGAWNKTRQGRINKG